MAGDGRDIVTTGAIGITAAIGTDASQRDWPIQTLVNSEVDASRQVGSITRLQYASAALGRVADVWQGFVRSDSLSKSARWPSPLPVAEIGRPWEIPAFTGETERCSALPA